MAPVGVIDSHCHLDRLDTEPVADVLARAHEAGVAGMVTIGTRLSEAPRQIALCRKAAPRVWCSIGTHPDHAGEEALPEPAALAAMAAPDCVIGIGETGLDYFHGASDARAAQQLSFRVHIRAARIADLPVVIHARDADDDVIAVLEDEHRVGGAFRLLLHCFSSGAALAERAVQLGGYVSFSGILTFPKSRALRDIARSLPLERLLVETDAPYLAPVPMRGRRNEPAFVVHTAAVLASLRGLAPEEMARLTTRNFHALFSKAA
ncbi:TatD family hydrolase [Lichenicoccus sp.]|uniref:TatD family hydrolase n=1 Tax=Lichenicoccus sp. TaxID=2781899 RepID=UPI003D0B023B